jgi:hypothetical protein
VIPSCGQCSITPTKICVQSRILLSNYRVEIILSEITAKEQFIFIGKLVIGFGIEVVEIIA